MNSGCRNKPPARNRTKEPFHRCGRLRCSRKFQPQPFLETPLGKLSPRTREKVYCYLSVACPQSEKWVEEPFCSRKDRDETFKDVFSIALFPAKRKADTDVAGTDATFGYSTIEHTPPDFVHLGASSLAILRVCRQLYNEAYPTL